MIQKKNQKFSQQNQLAFKKRKRNENTTIVYENFHGGEANIPDHNDHSYDSLVLRNYMH